MVDNTANMNRAKNSDRAIIGNNDYPIALWSNEGVIHGRH